MDWDVGKGRRGRRKRPVVRTAFLVCRTSLLRSVWIIAHRFEFASQVGIPTPPPDSFLPFWLLLICICFFFCFTVFLLFYSINNCVVSSWKNSPCLPGFALAKSFSGYLSAHVLFLVKCIVGFVTRTSAALLCWCFVSHCFCFCWFPALFFARSSLNFARLWLSSFDYRKSLKSIWPPFLFHFTTMFFSLLNCYHPRPNQNER
jgi:hypothetical protein